MTSKAGFFSRLVGKKEKNNDKKMGACLGSHQNVANESKGKGNGVQGEHNDLSQHDGKAMQRPANSGGIIAPKARRGIFTTPAPTTPSPDEFDLSQHEGRNLAFQMKNMNLKVTPSEHGDPVAAGMKRVLTVDSFQIPNTPITELSKTDEGTYNDNLTVEEKNGPDADSLSVFSNKTSERHPNETYRPVYTDNIVSVTYAGKTKKGFAPNNPKKKNQDSFLMKHDPLSSSLVIACFDGHGQFGHDVSKFCKQYLEYSLLTHPLFLSDLHKAIIDVVSSLEKEMLASTYVDTVFSGTTMILIIMQGTLVTVANVGDSRVVLGYKKEIVKNGSLLTDTAGTSPEDVSSIHSAQDTVSQKGSSFETKLSGHLASPVEQKIQLAIEVKEINLIDERIFGESTVIPLSYDHKPDMPAEKAVILEAGGRVKEVHGTARVYLALDDVPGLAMSRSLGDYVAHSAGVSSIPEITQYDLTALYDHQDSPDNKDSSNCIDSDGEVSVRCAILIATDGLYDMMSNERAVDVAFEHWGDPAAAAEELITETGNLWLNTWGLADDTTVCVVNLEHAGAPLGLQ
mmetsp:Transcript_20476/g.19801  ORF Transcript_20476/g.19801 Transcript_20476/m.19801 type:complete len:570 (-) Transcript_20476:129-1838(-)